MPDIYDNYGDHYKRLGISPEGLTAILSNPSEFALDEAWLPKDLKANILDIGCGWGSFLLGLWATGYRNLFGVDMSPSQCETARQALPADIKITCDDAVSFLEKIEKRFDLITLISVIEHVPVEQAIHLLSQCAQSLNPGGAVLVKTPNMGNILSGYGRYIDLTHVTGYTEWSLYQLLELSGFHNHQLIRDKPFSGDIWKKYRRWYAPWRGLSLRRIINDFIHRFLYSLVTLPAVPTTYDTSITIWSFVKK